jgi:hypothetical protein
MKKWISLHHFSAYAVHLISAAPEFFAPFPPSIPSYLGGIFKSAFLHQLKSQISENVLVWTVAGLLANDFLHFLFWI